MSKSRWIFAAAVVAFVAIGMALPQAAEAGRRHRGGWGCGCGWGGGGCCGTVSSCCDTGCGSTCDTGGCGGYTTSYGGDACCGSTFDAGQMQMQPSIGQPGPSGGQTFVPPPPSGAKAGAAPPAPPAANR
jgi:hypothetical protein